MEWQQIKGFYYIAQLRSFTKAADATFRTQSALSQQLKNLENELECQLVERIGKQKIKLTLSGEKFFKFSKLILSEYETIKNEIHEINGLDKGILKIAAPYTTLYNLFPVPIKKYTTLFPNVEISIYDRSQEMIISLIKDGDIDFGFALTSQIPNEFLSIPWKKVENVVITPVNHPLTKIRKISAKHLIDYPLILPPRSHKKSFRNRFEKRFNKFKKKYKIVMESSNVELSALYTELGLGISFATVVPDLLIDKKRKIELIKLDHLFDSDQISIVMKKNSTFASYKKAFIKTLFEN